ncbi:hypothetical protein [Dactylosporangium salmoneum]|uniref:Haemophore haem-binding domain-containing protein n=1 Tax=Dactylosporangium salmoneum TaxID=53361 RepID=A0ABN3FC93_9ACTN
MTDPYPQKFGHPSTWPTPAEEPSPPPLMLVRPRRRTQAAVRMTVAAAAAVTLTGGALVVAGATGAGPAAGIFKDPGVAACEQIRDGAAAARSRPPGAPRASSPDDLEAYQAFRKQFADSRYGDLRAAGTEVLDLLHQLSGADPAKDEDAGLTLVVAGPLVQKWATLTGACGNHGVTIPKLTELN